MPFFMHCPRPLSPFLTPGFPRLLLLSPVFEPSAPPPCQLLTTKLPFLSREQKKICIVVSPWIWKPHGRVNVREVWQQQSIPVEGGTKNSETLCFYVEREPAIGRLSDERQKAAFKALIARHSEIPLKVSFPSNYIFHFISAFRQTASEALEKGRGKKNNKKTVRSSVSLCFSFFYIKSEFERRGKKKCWNWIKMKNKLSIYLLYISPLINTVITRWYKTDIYIYRCTFHGKHKPEMAQQQFKCF